MFHSKYVSLKPLLFPAKAALLAAGLLLPSQCALASEAPTRIVTTIFPEYDWIMNLLGSQAENVEVINLTDSGVDLHNYNPSVEDIVTISTCSLFVYVGGESDFWVQEILEQYPSGDRTAVSLMELLPDRLREEEIVEGMQDHASLPDSEEDEPEYDEHVWLSLKNAAVICTGLADALGEMDPSHASEYRQNAESYLSKLDSLDAAYTAALKDAPFKTLVFGDRFPFRYLFEDYSLAYYAAFSGCFAESEASFETIVFLAEKLDELGLDSILKTETADTRLCETVIESTPLKNQKILTLDSMQSVKREDREKGSTYLSIMEKNLEVLKEACHVPA